VRESYAFQEAATRLRIVSDTIKLFGAFLPSGADRWLNAYARDPAWFLLWVGVIGFLIWYGSSLKSEMNSRMRRIWNDHLGRIKAPSPESSGFVWTMAWKIFTALLLYIAIYPILDGYPLFNCLKPPEPWHSLITTYSKQPMRFVLCAFLIAHFLPERVIGWLRTRQSYQRSLSYLKLTLAPFLFAMMILYGTFAVANHLLFNVRDSFGFFCRHGSDAEGPLNAGNPGFACDKDAKKCTKTITLDSSLTDHTSLCLPTGVFAERGKRYKIDISRDKEKWQFWGKPSFLSGQPISRLGFWKGPLIAMMLPFRRTLDRPWSSVIVRYGPTGTEESFLDPKPPKLDDSLVRTEGDELEKIPDEESLGEEWTARRDGEIYVYLNKPVLGIWGIEAWISRYFIPNTGTAHITLESR
jgi:hypothetical protein